MLIISKNITMNIFVQRQVEWMNMIIHGNTTDFPISSLNL